MKRTRYVVIGFAMCLGMLAVSSDAGAQAEAYDWETVADTHPGIRLTQTSVCVPRVMKIYCLRIDTDNPDIAFHVTPRCTNWVEDVSEATRKTTRHFLKEARKSGMNMVAATNAASWEPWPAPCRDEEDVNVLGLMVSDGVMVSPASHFPTFIVYRNGDVTISATSPSTDLENIYAAISGFGFVLVDGVVNPSGDDLAPRTGIGVCPAGRYVYWLTIDGRQRASEGATLSDVGQWLLYYGAWNGLNMDGGGSTTMALWRDNLFCGKTRVINRPVGCSDVGTERAVGGNLGVYCRTPIETKWFCGCTGSQSRCFEVGKEMPLRIPGLLFSVASLNTGQPLTWPGS